jgi:hypothetical protein
MESAICRRSLGHRVSSVVRVRAALVSQAPWRPDFSLVP